MYNASALVALQLAAGEWYAPGTKSRKQATQYFEVVGYLTNRYICVRVCVYGRRQSCR